MSSFLLYKLCYTIQYMKPLRNLIPFYLVGFLFAVHTALILYSNSSFLNQFINESYLGFLYTGGSLIAILGLITLPKILARIGSRLTMMILTLIIIAICIVNITVGNPFVILALFTLFFASNIMFFLANDIVIDQVAHNDSVMGTIRGSYITAVHIGYIAAPGLAGFILARLGFSALYALAGLMLVPLLFLLFKTRSIRSNPHEKISIRKSLALVSKNKDLRNILGANFILQIFYSWMVIYTPIFLHETLGIPWDSIGTIFSLMLLAFILIPIPVGKIADSVTGEKTLLFFGFTIMGVSTALLYFLPHFTLPLLALILFGTRIGASSIETLTESYFYKHIPHSETEAIGILKSTYPVAYIIGPLLASIIISFFTPQHLFLVLGIICIGSFVFLFPLSSKIKKLD
jgi:MFS family permease